MDANVHERYRAETRRLVARRGPLGALLFAAGVGFAGLLEYHYRPERLLYLLFFFALELIVCLVTIASFRSPRLRRFGIGLTQSACIALISCVTAYGGFAGINGAALAFLLIVFELTTALMFPWGAYNQALVAAACVLFGAVYVLGGGGTEGTLPVAYELYAIATAGLVSVLGAGFLDRQRLAIFTQREQLDQHLATFRDLTRTLHGFEPKRILLRTCTSMLETFGLRRLWVLWQAAGSGAVQGYLVRTIRDGVTWTPLTDSQPLWAWIAGWQDSAQAFLVRSTDPEIPASLREGKGDTLLCIPIGEKEDRFGAICADRDGEPMELGERELGLASVLVSGTAVAMANAGLYQQVTAASEEKSVFLARIAHELRNPLQAVLWDLDTLREGDHARHQQLERVQQNTLMTLDIAKELQEFGEIETKRLCANPEPINLAQTVDNLQATAMALLEGRPIAFRTQVAKDAQVIVTDPFRLRQILSNLIANAAKFTARGAIEVDARRAGTEIAISVRDSGCGIESADLAHIFTPFYRGSAHALTPARGMGLGLAIAHEIALLLGGRIEVESAVGSGSTFRLLLPADVASMETEAPASAAAALPGTVTLLVEDDPDCRARTADALRRSGAHVIEASDGFEGLRRAREEQPDVIVLDLGLPGLGGIDVLAHLKRDPQLGDVPVVIATADTDPQLEARCRAAGCAAYVRKPYAPQELLRVLVPLTARQHEIDHALPQGR